MAEEYQFKTTRALANYLRTQENRTYQAMIQRARSDKAFEGMIKDMSVNRLFGGSKLSKYKRF